MLTNENSVIRLQLSLNHLHPDEESVRILKTYKDSVDGVSLTRDILVPADMTLHALHSAIMRLFG